MKTVLEMMQEDELIDQAARAHPDSVEWLPPVITPHVDNPQLTEAEQEQEAEDESGESPDLPETIDPVNTETPDLPDDALPSDNVDHPDDGREDPRELTEAPELMSLDLPEFDQPEETELGTPDVAADVPDTLDDQPEQEQPELPSEDLPDISQNVSDVGSPEVSIPANLETPENVVLDENDESFPEVDAPELDIDDSQDNSQSNISQDSSDEEDSQQPDIELSPLVEATVSQEQSVESLDLAATAPEGSDSENFEQPELPTSLEFDEPNTSSSSDSGVVSFQDQQPDLVGFQGYQDSTSVHQSTLDQQEIDELPMTQDERINHQIDQQMRSNENLAASLARELGPEFESIRAGQEQTVRDYVSSQQLLASLLRVR